MFTTRTAPSACVYNGGGGGGGGGRGEEEKLKNPKRKREREDVDSYGFSAERTSIFVCV